MESSKKQFSTPQDGAEQSTRKRWDEMSTEEQVAMIEAGGEKATVDESRGTVVVGPSPEDEEELRAHEDFLAKVGELTAENPDRPDIVKEELGLSPAKLNEMGYTRLAELQEEARPVYEARKAEAEQAEAERKAEAERQAAEKLYEDRKQNIKKAHEAAWAANDEYAEKRAQEKAQADRDEALANKPASELMKMSTTELAEVAGISYGEALRLGKSGVAQQARERVQARQEADKEARTYKVPVDTEAERRQSEYAKMLRDFDRSMLLGKAAITEQRNDRNELLQSIAGGLQSKIDKDRQTETEEYDPGDLDTDVLIKDWAHAEIAGDSEMSKKIQDELQERIAAMWKAGEIDNDGVSAEIDDLYDWKERVKTSILKGENEETEEVDSEEPQEVDNAENAEENEAGGNIVEFRARRRSMWQRFKDRVALIDAKYRTEGLKGVFGREDKEGRKPSWVRKVAIFGAFAMIAAGVIGISKDKQNNFKSESDATVEHIDEQPAVNTEVELLPAVTITASAEDKGIDTTQYSWRVAHELSPGHENEVMQKAIDQYNETHGTNFALTPRPNGKVWIMDGKRAISPAEMQELNKLMRVEL